MRKRALNLDYRDDVSAYVSWKAGRQTNGHPVTAHYLTERGSAFSIQRYCRGTKGLSPKCLTSSLNELRLNVKSADNEHLRRNSPSLYAELSSQP
jgi:hypothetical protein